MDAADGEVYRKYADELTRFATGLVGPSDAADVVADAVLSCLSSRHWSSVTEKRPYLYRSVYHKAAELHRGSHRRMAREKSTARSDTYEQPEVRPEVLAAVLKLSVKQRAVIVLTYWDDLRPGDIATLLKTSEGSVKRHLTRGRFHLKETLHADD